MQDTRFVRTSAAIALASLCVCAEACTTDGTVTTTSGYDYVAPMADGGALDGGTLDESSLQWSRSCRTNTADAAGFDGGALVFNDDAGGALQMQFNGCGGPTITHSP